MEITTRDYPHANVIRVTGRVDAGTYAELENKIKEYLDSGHKHLVLELDGIEYLSSAGVRVLISTQKTLKPRGGNLALAQPSARVKDVLQLAGVDVLFPTYDTTVAALGNA
jgi:anti-sigma B factor antagonist